MAQTKDSLDPKNPDRDLEFMFKHGLQFGRGEHVSAEAVVRIMSVHQVFFSTMKSEENPLDFLDKATASQESAKTGENLDEDLFADKSPVGFRKQEKFTYDDVVSVSRVDEADVDDFYYVNGLLPVIDLAIRASSQAAVASLPSVKDDQELSEKLGLGLDGFDDGNELNLKWSEGGRGVVEFATHAFAELAQFVLDNDEDDDDWGKSQFSRQGLLQDLGVLDKIVEVLKNPLLGLNALEDQPPTDPTTLGEEATKIVMNRGNSLFPEFQDGLDGSAFGLWDMAFRALSNAALGDESSTDKYLARHYKVFVNHMLFLKTDGAAEVLIELFEDNREAIDDLIKGTYEPEASGFSSEETKRDPKKAGGLGWILSKLESSESMHGNTDFIDHDYYNFLSSLCVCKELAVRTSQEPILEKMETLGEKLAKYGHFSSIQESQVKRGKIDFQVTFKRGKKTISVGNQLIGVGTQADDIELYYEPVQGDEENESRYHFLLSNLKVCAHLCNGHWTGPEKIVGNLMNGEFSTLISLAKSTEITYAIRTRALEIMLEMYLETQGNLTVLSDDKLELVYTRDSGLGLDANGLNRNATDKTKEFNDARAHYLLGKSAPVVDQSKRINWGSKKAEAPEDPVGDDFGFLGWVGYKEGFRADLKKFSREMCRLNKTSDTYEPWHQEHGEFVTAVLDQIYFACESGFFDARRLEQEFSLDPAEMVHVIVRVLVEDLLFFAAQLIDVGITATDADEHKEEMIMSVLDKALHVLELLETQQQFGALSTFIENFMALQGGGSKDDLPSTLKRFGSIIGDTKNEKPVALSDVNNYLNTLHNSSSISSEGVFDSQNAKRSGLTDMLHTAYEREKTYIDEKANELRTLSESRCLLVCPPFIVVYAAC